VADPDEPRIVFTASSQVDRLRMEVAVLRERVRALEVIARERGERVTDLRTILRMLPAPKEPEEAPVASAEEEPPPEEEAAQAEDETQPVNQGEMPVADEEDLEASEPAVEAHEPPAPSRVLSAFDRSEPVVILPEAPPTDEQEPSEGAFDRSAEMLASARQRSTEALDDAMSMWWPSPATQTELGERPSPWTSSALDEGPVRDDPVQTERAWAQASRAVTPTTHSTPAVEPDPSPPPDPETSGKTDLFTQSTMDESSLDWVDPDFGRPRQRRLRRLFRRNRRPR
jgi:hypothetical protein